jgi:hypothetical protein
VLVLGRFNFGVRPTVDAELLVGNDVLLLGQVLIHLLALRLEERVIGKDAGARVESPVEWRLRVAFAFHVLSFKS